MTSGYIGLVAVCFFIYLIFFRKKKEKKTKKKNNWIVPVAILVLIIGIAGSGKTVLQKVHPARSTSLSGTLDCAQLEQLWEAAGGSPSTAFLAAEVAMAESGGQQNPPSNASQNYNGKTDVGYFQINSGIYPSLATTDPIGNAKAAIIISKDGTYWSPWVTYQQGLEVGKC